MSRWMRPPFALYLLAGDELGDVGNGPMSGLEQGAAADQKSEYLGVFHELWDWRCGG